MNYLSLKERFEQLPDARVLKRFDNPFDELSTVTPYVPPAEQAASLAEDAADAIGRPDLQHEVNPPAASNAAQCSELQQRETDCSAAATDATQCSGLQHSENVFSDAQASDAAQCNELQQRKSDCSAGEKPISPTTESPPESEQSGGLPDDFAGSLTNFARTVLSPRQQSAIKLLVAGETDTAVAHKLNVDRTTVWRWKRHRHFRAVLEEARELVFGAAIDRLHELAPRAIDILQRDLEISNDPRSAIRLLRLIRVDRVPRGEPSQGIEPWRS